MGYSYRVHRMGYIFGVHRIGYNVWGTSYRVQCMGYIIWRTSYRVQCMGYIVWGTMYGVHRIVYINRGTSYRVHLIWLVRVVSGEVWNISLYDEPREVNYKFKYIFKLIIYTVVSSIICTPIYRLRVLRNLLQVATESEEVLRNSRSRKRDLSNAQFLTTGFFVL